MMADTSISDISNSRSYEYTDGEWRKRIEAVFNELTKSYGDSFINSDYSKIQFEEIDNAIDFNKDEKYLSNFFNKIEEELGDTSIQGYWNESIVALYNYFKDSISKDDYEENKEDDWNKRIKLIKDANAGFSFLNDPYVKPDLNIDNDSYKDVRGDDKIESVLQNSKNMQYTHTQEQIDGKILNKYIRLLMPKYTRRVEVEDLNRNFWVIGQALGLMSAYLLDPESALNQILNAILNELGEIWNNIYELWAIIGDLCGEIYNLWLKTNEIENQISELGSAVSKTKIVIDLQQMHKNSSFGDFILNNSEINTEINQEKPNSFIIQKLYFLGDTDEKEPIFQNKALLKNKYPWLFDNNDKLIYSNGSYAYNPNFKYSFHNFFGANKSKWIDKYVCPRLGAILEYKNNGQLDYLAYDVNHPWLYSKEDIIDNCGLYSFMTAWVNQTTFLPLNSIIKFSTYQEKDIFNYKKNALNEIKDTYGPFSIDRKSFDKRTLGEILVDISQANFTLVSLTESRPDLKTPCIWDALPCPIKYDSNEILNTIRTFFKILSDFKISAEEEMLSQNKYRTVLEWNAIVVIKNLIENIFKNTPFLTYKEEINYNLLSLLIKDSILMNNQDLQSDLNSIINNIKIFNNNKNIDNYSNLIQSILKINSLDIITYLEKQNIVITEENISDYKDDYLNWVKESELKNGQDFENQLKTIKIFLPEGSVPLSINGENIKVTSSEDYTCYGRSNPFLMLNFCETGWSYKPSWIADDSSGIKDYYLAKCGVGRNNEWMLCSNFYPNTLCKDIYTIKQDENGKEVIDILHNSKCFSIDQNKKVFIEDVVNKNKECVSSFVEDSINKKIYFYNNNKIEELDNIFNYYYESGLFISGNNSSISHSDDTRYSKQYCKYEDFVQPYFKLNGYWIIFKTDNFQNVFLLNGPHIAQSNFQFYNGRTFKKFNGRYAKISISDFYDFSVSIPITPFYDKNFNNVKLTDIFQFNRINAAPMSREVIHEGNKLFTYETQLFDFNSDKWNNFYNNNENSFCRWTKRSYGDKNMFVDGIFCLPNKYVISRNGQISTDFSSYGTGAYLSTRVFMDEYGLLSGAPEGDFKKVYYEGIGNIVPFYSTGGKTWNNSTISDLMLTNKQINDQFLITFDLRDDDESLVKNEGAIICSPKIVRAPEMEIDNPDGYYKLQGEES